MGTPIEVIALNTGKPTGRDAYLPRLVASRSRSARPRVATGQDPGEDRRAGLEQI